VPDFLAAPLRPAEGRGRIWRILAQQETRHVAEACTLVTERIGLDLIVGEDPAFAAIKAKLPAVARAEATVLISGETGTGKEVVARGIHYLSRRARGPFLPVDCGAIPVELFENELFGHRRGAFTDARETAAGLIAAADGGTIFLDEVHAIPVPAQTKLLRFLQTQHYRPLGSGEFVRADVRIIAATNADLEAGIKTGAFRQDLYYRLNIISLALPPLRERRGDIPLLARHFLARHAGPEGRERWQVEPDVLECLERYAWPGNVRELENVIQQVVALAPAGPLGLEALPLRFHRREDVRLPRSFREAKAQAVATFERDYIERLLSAHRGNITQAARAARKDRRAFGRLVQKYTVECPESRRSG
jgi:DNA-binding NtrC family response regulator